MTTSPQPSQAPPPKLLVVGYESFDVPGSRKTARVLSFNQLQEFGNRALEGIEQALIYKGLTADQQACAHATIIEFPYTIRISSASEAVIRKALARAGYFVESEERKPQPAPQPQPLVENAAEPNGNGHRELSPEVVRLIARFNAVSAMASDIARQVEEEPHDIAELRLLAKAVGLAEKDLGID